MTFMHALTCRGAHANGMGGITRHGSGSVPDLRALSFSRRKAMASSFYADSSRTYTKRSLTPVSQRGTPRASQEAGPHAPPSLHSAPSAPINTPASVQDTTEADERLPEGSPSNFSYADAKMMIRWSNEVSSRL